MTYRILITGSRSWTDQQSIAAALLEARDNSGSEDEHRIVVVLGDCESGVDQIAYTWATRWGWITETHRAAWDRYGKAAGPRRNQRMVELGADVCLAFAKSWASGTGHCARAARKAGIRTVDLGVSTRVEDRP